MKKRLGIIAGILGIYLKRNGLNVILEEISAIFRTYI